METAKLPLKGRNVRLRKTGPRKTLITITLLILLVALMPVAGQTPFPHTTNNGMITITGYTGPNGDVSIPDVINGWPVTSIGSRAFEYTRITHVAIPDSVIRIEHSAFSYCTNLANIAVGNNVANIGINAFIGCSRLASVTIPGSVTNLEMQAFYGCDSLTNVVIPSSVIGIGERPFGRCANLTAIIVDADNPAYTSTDGVLFDKSRAILIQYPGGIITGGYSVPNGVTVIANSAFAACDRLTNVTIPDGVTTIDFGVFQGCSNLLSISLPDSIVTIKDVAFALCPKLADVRIPSGVTNIPFYTFAYCTGLTNVTIPSSVTGIEFQAFQNCTALRNVYFQGDAPGMSPSSFVGTPATLYYLPGTEGWGPAHGGRPTALWHLPNPVSLRTGLHFGVSTNQFGFLISWATNRPVAVDACEDLSNPAWSPVGTNILTDGTAYFSDPLWTNSAARLYRLRGL